MPVDGPFTDDLGKSRFLEPLAVNGLEKLRPGRLRRDILTSLNFVMWEFHRLGGFDIVLGVGAGAIISALLGRPRFVEMALASKVLRPSDVVHMHQTWHAMRAIFLWRPHLTKAYSSLQALQEAFPELDDMLVDSSDATAGAEPPAAFLLHDRHHVH